jgi:hypothetical protein
MSRDCRTILCVWCRVCKVVPAVDPTMYVQNPKDEHRIFDSLSLRAHYSYERPDVPSSFLQSTLPMPFSPTLAPVAGPNSAVSQQRSYSTSLFNEHARRIAARQVSGSLVSQPCRITLEAEDGTARGERNLTSLFLAPPPLSQVVRSPTPLLVVRDLSIRVLQVPTEPSP